MVEMKKLDGTSTSDGLTALYPEPSNPDAINPYMAFFDPNDAMFRPFKGNATLAASYVLLKDNSYKVLSMVYKIDASYPTNAPEPVASYVYPLTPDDHIYPSGSHATIIIDFTDWQDDISTAALDLTNINISGMQPMQKLSKDKTQHTSRWEYYLNQAVGGVAIYRTIRAQAVSSGSALAYYRDFELPVTYDNDPPVWLNPDQKGIYDAISGPEELTLFFYQAWDASTPLHYIFWGNTQQGRSMGVN